MAKALKWVTQFARSRLLNRSTPPLMARLLLINRFICLPVPVCHYMTFKRTFTPRDKKYKNRTQHSTLLTREEKGHYPHVVTIRRTCEINVLVITKGHRVIMLFCPLKADNYVMFFYCKANPMT